MKKRTIRINITVKVKENGDTEITTEKWGEINNLEIIGILELEKIKQDRIMHNNYKLEKEGK